MLTSRHSRSTLALAALAGWLALSGCDSALFGHGERSSKPRGLGQGEVEVWVTTADGAKRLEPAPRLSFSSRDPGPGPTRVVSLDESEAGLRQEIDGFGASLTESAAFALEAHLSADTRDELWRKLFSRDDGIALGFLRQPMGGSDFALSFYSYDDSPASPKSPTLQAFSIARDRRFIIPLLKKARALNPDLKLMGSPWSAPAHMKVNGKLTHGSALLPAAYQPFADYFAAFLEAYQAEGLPIYAVSPQNEPLYENDYMSMSMSWQEQARFVRDHLGPTLDREGLDTKILLFDHNWRDAWYPLAALEDPGVRRFAKAVAFHCYEAGSEPENMSVLSSAYPDIELYVTECSGYRIRGVDEPFGKTLGWIARKLLIRSIRYGARAVVRWNLALDEQSGPVAPSQQGCKGCTGLAMIDFDGDYQLTADYFALGHASKFVAPGARRLDSTTFEDEGLETVAFRNPDGSTVLLVLNGSALEAIDFAVSTGRGTFEARQEPGSLTTYVWPP